MMNDVRVLACVMGLTLGACSSGPATSSGPALIFFVGAECPVSNFYAPDIQRIGEEWRSRGGIVWLVYAEPGLSVEEAGAHAGRYGLSGTIILDVHRSLAAAHGVTRLPTAVVPDVYRGRIDDRFSPEGKRRDVPRTRDLEDALAALVAGRSPAMRETPVFGCPLP